MTETLSPPPKIGHKAFLWPGWFWDILLDWDRLQVAGSLLIILAMAVLPIFVTASYYLGIIVLTALYAYVGISWNISTGFAGQLLIAHVIFVGVGAYTTIVLLDRFGISPWLGIPAAGLVSGVLGLVVSYITLRYGLKADYAALFTIALMLAMSLLFNKFQLVGAAAGLGVSFHGESLKMMTFVAKTPYLYIALGLLSAAVAVQYLVYRSKLGAYMIAIRENEAAASALGVNTALYKTLAVLISTAMGGIGGGFYVVYVTFVQPGQVFNLSFNVAIVLAGPIIGGLGSLIGPILGAVVNKPIVELLRGALAAQRGGTDLIVYGLFLITFMLFVPKGIAGLLYGPYDSMRRALQRRG